MIDFATAHDRAAIDQLLDLGFGPARRARTAYRLREDSVASLELVARDGAAVIGSVQLWPVVLRTGSRCYALTLLGPLAVDPARRGAGLGGALIDAALARIPGPVVLIGDAPYYARFGFAADLSRRWTLPGPVDPARLLVRDGDALPFVAQLEAPSDARLAA